MEIKIESATIQNVWEALQQVPSNPRFHQAEKLFIKKMKKGWIFLSNKLKR
ncbi:hypothetical protein P872_21860 [Rhodonellum psychrophilum GCM71 = DSM 17998]|uniref:Uncharacterized protein n=2 Tax=Rhodonellum TaxID=336827 RepID=U5BRB3_9BACT|nr:hypothetical protein P872_21860 [Rhodonellum psychrophilum GCM71 = DSM 17998]SDZ24745.1 hypothetical protein SAMN05444412_108102 [Rhodonellum ikkaensis]